MSIRKKGKYYYGETHEDIAEVLQRYSATIYPVAHTANSICECGCDTFTVLLNEDPGVVVRICLACDSEHGIGDADEYIDEVDEVHEMQCICGSNAFKITSAVALYSESEDVRWFYVGLLCTKCGCTGCYSDWKNEFVGYKALLDNV